MGIAEMIYNKAPRPVDKSVKWVSMEKRDTRLMETKKKNPKGRSP